MCKSQRWVMLFVLSYFFIVRCFYDNNRKLCVCELVYGCAYMCMYTYLYVCLCTRTLIYLNAAIVDQICIWDRLRHKAGQLKEPLDIWIICLIKKE